MENTSDQVKRSGINFEGLRGIVWVKFGTPR